MSPAPERILAIDYGTRWLGLAWSDPSLTIVAGSRTIDRKQTKVPILTVIQDFVQEMGVREVIVGMPYNMDGSTGPKAQETLAFMEELEKRLEIPVSSWDERLTTVRAADELRRLGGKRGQRRRVDEMSASFILQDYLKSISRS
jgi:putative Holliday junction resolvase